LFTKNIIKYNMYWDGIVKISNFWNRGLHDTLVDGPVIIHIYIYWILRTFLLNGEFPWIHQWVKVGIINCCKSRYIIEKVHISDTHSSDCATSSTTFRYYFIFICLPIHVMIQIQSKEFYMYCLLYIDLMIWDLKNAIW